MQRFTATDHGCHGDFVGYGMCVCVWLSRRCLLDRFPESIVEGKVEVEFVSRRPVLEGREREREKERGKEREREREREKERGGEGESGSNRREDEQERWGERNEGGKRWKIRDIETGTREESKYGESQ